MNVIPEPTDHVDCGPMGSYGDENKPSCAKCGTDTFVIATGRTHKWVWSCTNCVVEMQPYINTSHNQAPSKGEK